MDIIYPVEKTQSADTGRYDIDKLVLVSVSKIKAADNIMSAAFIIDIYFSFSINFIKSLSTSAGSAGTS